jgi:hypothetical protein
MVTALDRFTESPPFIETRVYNTRGFEATLSVSPDFKSCLSVRYARASHCARGRLGDRVEKSGGVEEPAAESGGFFAPDTTGDQRPGRGRSALPWWRLVLRFALLAVALWGVDMLVARTLQPDAQYSRAYRLPVTLPTASIADYVASIHSSSLSERGGPIVVFAGASPTWGHRIKDAANTYPYAFQSAAREAGWPSRTFNLASNGQFVADEYFITKKVAEDADVVFVQLTYHTFNPTARGGAVMRYPELPRLLGMSLDTTEAALLGSKPSIAASGVSRIDRALSERWLLWRERDALDRRFFGGKPQQVLASRSARQAPATRLSSDTAPPDDGFAAFEQLEPGQQMIVISRYAEDASFNLNAEDSDVRFLALLARDLAARGKKAVFYVGPLNRQLIGDYELIDPAQYAANIAVIRAPIEAAGFRLLDYNTGPDVLPIEYFADISHTNDAGGKAVGALLWRDTREYLRAGRP